VLSGWKKGEKDRKKKTKVKKNFFFDWGKNSTSEDAGGAAIMSRKSAQKKDSVANRKQRHPGPQD